MKKLIGLLSLLLVITSAPVFAEQSSEITEALQQKKLLVLDNLKLSNEEEIAFLPVYNAFQKDKLNVNREKAALLESFAENYNALTNVKAQEILDQWFVTEQEMLTLKKSYVPKFQKVISKKQTMRYYQIENKLEALVNRDMVEAIPLAQ